MAGSTVTRKKRSKLKIALLAPLLAVSFIVGWSLYWIGQAGQKKPTNKPSPTQEKVQLMAIPTQEELIVTN